ncbi:hypothetical protein ACLKA6_004709 [Drosophila palustris]
MISAGIFLCLCLVSAFNYFRQRRQRKFVANLKGPFAWPLVGSILKIVLLTPKIADLELARQLFLSESHLDTGYELMRDWLADSVLMCESDQWTQRHQRLTAFFQKDKMSKIIKLLQEQAEKPYPDLLAHAETRQVFNVWPIVSAKIMDFILATNCGVHPSEQYKQAFASLIKLYRKRFLSIKSAHRLIFMLASPFTRRRQQKLIKSLNEENIRILEQCRQHQLVNNQAKIEGITIDHIEPTTRLDHQSLIDVLNGSENLSDDQLLAELNTCNFLGYLLCSTTLCFALILIARHPAVQQRCLEELRIAHSGKDGNLQEMPFLESVLKETLRLHPPQLIVGRELSSDFPYTHSKAGDAALPAGAEVYINLYEMQRSEEHYGQDASHFQPERFLDKSCELLSFGMGPRSCPAQQFSLMLLKSFIAPLLLQFELLPYGDALRPDLQMAPGSSNGFQLAVKSR